MSEKELLEKEDGLEEAKASFGVEAEVPEPSTKENTPPGAKPKDEDKTKNPEQGDSVKPTKVSAIQNISQAVKGISQAKLESVMPKIMAALTEEEGEAELEEACGKKVSIKEMPKVTSEDVDVKEDVVAMFNGEDLSEEFTSKATTIFEAAVVSKVNEILETVTIDLEGEMEATKQEIEEEFAAKLDSYLGYVAEEWMAENELAVEQGIRAEIAENFMRGLKDLFNESYIDIPEEKADLVDELAAKVEELQAGINEEIEKNINLKKTLDEAKKEIVLTAVSEGLTESQSIKLSSLAEGVEFEDESSYAEKLETIKENYFATSETVLTEETNFDDEPLEIKEDAEKAIDPGMAAYITAISKSIKK
jgi:hypothetical protein